MRGDPAVDRRLDRRALDGEAGGPHHPRLRQSRRQHHFVPSRSLRTHRPHHRPHPRLRLQGGARVQPSHAAQLFGLHAEEAGPGADHVGESRFRRAEVHPRGPRQAAGGASAHRCLRAGDLARGGWRREGGQHRRNRPGGRRHLRRWLRDLRDQRLQGDHRSDAGGAGKSLRPKHVNSRFPIPVGAVVLDLDGTLLDTVDDLAVAANAMLEELGFEPLPEPVIRTHIGKGLQNLVTRCLAEATGAEPAAAQVERALAVFEPHYRANLCVRTRPYPGVVEGLEALRQAGFPLGCVTNKAERFTLPLLQQAGLAPYFDLVIGGDTLPRKKPDPLPLVHAAERFGVPPAQLLLVGDSPNDTQAARAAGCPVVCVPYGYSEGAKVQDLDCDAIVASIREVPSLLRKVQP
ncbi:MAG: phosphoglycolate phosphatase [Azospira oryzae]|nr:MAG: phosphoglycolate phosphatase [Azospira oryzae]PZP83117.1 MAG: phosphoglycolate phosphatase [Azospira oryzae]